MPDEDVQELGREGVGMVKAWLEATTWMEFPYNAYEHKHRCVIPLLNSQKKKFDLKGFHLGDKTQRRDLYVECKRYNSASGQHAYFREFLAIAYSFHSFQKDLHGVDVADDFIWVTSHPFQIGQWAELCTKSFMLDVLSDDKNQKYLGDDHEVDEELAQAVASRVWLLVLNEDKQMKVSLTSSELKTAMTQLKREGTSLWEH